MLTALAVSMGICENLKDFFLVEWKRIARWSLHWKVKALRVQVLCLSAFLSLLKEEEHSSALLWFVALSSLSGNPSHLASGQFQQLTTLLIVFVSLMISSQIWACQELLSLMISFTDFMSEYLPLPLFSLRFTLSILSSWKNYKYLKILFYTVFT